MYGTITTILWSIMDSLTSQQSSTPERDGGRERERLRVRDYIKFRYTGDRRITSVNKVSARVEIEPAIPDCGDRLASILPSEKAR
jgi:hypothetical protein